VTLQVVGAVRSACVATTHDHDFTHPGVVKKFGTHEARFARHHKHGPPSRCAVCSRVADDIRFGMVAPDLHACPRHDSEPVALAYGVGAAQVRATPRRTVIAVREHDIAERVKE